MRLTRNGRRIPIEIVGSSKYGRYPKISSERTINMIVSDKWLINSAGYQKILQIFPQGEGREIFVSIRGGFMLVVINQNVYSINEALAPTLVGQLTSFVGEVFIDENLNSQICIVDGANCWIYYYGVGGPSFTLQVLGGTLIPNYVEFHNNQFLFGNANTTANGAFWYAYVYSSNTTIAEAIPSGQFALQTKPDFALAVVRLPGQSANVLVLGTSVCEIWTQIGGLQNYRKNNTIGIDYGCISVSTIAKNDEFVAWLGVNETSAPVICIYTGQGFKPISTDGIDYELSQIKFPEQSTAMFYRQDGHLFYQLTFFNAADNKTYLYDFKTGMFFNPSDQDLNYHIARNFAYFNNNTYFISLNNGSVYQSSTNFNTYNENLPGIINPNTDINYEIPFIRICDTYQADDSSQFRANSFVFTMEQGSDANVTTLSLTANADLLITEDMFFPQDSIIITEGGIPVADEDSSGGIGQPDLPLPYQPRVDLSYSTNGGITYSNTVGYNLNPLGYRQNIINWQNMGAMNTWTPMLRFWSTFRWVINNGVLEVY